MFWQKILYRTDTHSQMFMRIEIQWHYLCNLKYNWGMNTQNKRCVFQFLILLTAMISLENFGFAQFPQRFPIGNVQGQNPASPVVVEAYPIVTGSSYASTIISANAQLIRAQGAAREAIARANLINGYARIKHAEALAAEGKYFNDWVSSRHELRRMQKEWIREQNPRMYERAAKADNVAHEIIVSQPRYVIEKLDITNRLNYMLGHVTTELYAQEIINGGVIFGGQSFNTPITPEDISKIYVQRTETVSGKPLRFRLERLSMGDQELPLVFDRPVLREAAAIYIKERSRILGLIANANPKPRYEDYNVLKLTLDDLEAALENTLNVYARTNPDILHQYHVGRRFIFSQVAGVTHAIRTGETEHLTGLPSFNGKTLGSLLDFMVKNGMEFSRFEYTGKATYEKLFLAMRSSYLGTRKNLPDQN